MRSRSSEGRRARHSLGSIGVVLVAVTFASAGLCETPAAAGETPGSDAPAGGAAAPPADVERARAAFVEGAELVRQTRWTQALAAFEESWGLVPHPGTAYNIAFCERALGHYTRARKMFSRAIDDNVAHGSAELPESTALEAKGYLEEIESQLARIDVTIEPSGTALALSVDGRPLEATTHEGEKETLVAGTTDPGPGQAVPAPEFTLLLDPGPHVLVLSRPGHPDAVRNETFAAGVGSLRWTAEDKAEDAGAAPKVGQARPAVPGKDVDQPAPKRNRTAAYIALGAGGAGILTGSVLGIWALTKKTSLDGECTGGHCPPEARSDYDTTGRLADGATIAFGVGAAGLGVGAYLLFFSGSARAPARPSVQARIGPSYVSLSGSFQ